jgi:polyether ionophore transport system permease protein
MATQAAPLQAPVRISPLSRIYGFGSIYGKTIRDSRLAFIIAVGLLGGLALFMGAAISQVFPTTADRTDINKLIGGMPGQMVDLFGNPVKLGTLGGYMSWKYGSTFEFGTAFWSIFALSGTLAGEAGRGSLDFVAATPFGKRRIAIEKLAAHVTLLALALIIMAVCATLSSNMFGDASLGDQIPPLGAFGFALQVGLLALLFGGLAFALGPILGRAGAAGMSLVVMATAWIVNPFSALGPIRLFSPFYWLFNNVPLAQTYDWPPLALVGVVAIVFLVIGVELFTRRDLGVTAGLSLPTLPGAVLGVRGLTTRSFGEQLPRALAWGIGMAVWAGILVGISGSFAQSIEKSSDLVKTFGSVFPGLDFTTAGAWLTLFAELLYIAAGLAATTFVSKWASDEGDGRLEMLLATPKTRSLWALTGGIAAILAVAVMTILFALGTAVGAAAAGGGYSATDAVLGSTSLGLFGIAVVGVGFAVGGWWRTSIAAEIAAAVVIATYLIDLIAPPLNLPDWFQQLALIAHYGRPMVGQWDVAGVVASVVIAAAGIAIGTVGVTRRDIAK